MVISLAVWGALAPAASADPPPSAVALSSDRASVKVGESFTLTATPDRNPWWAGYSTYIIDDDSGATVAICGNATSCKATLTIPWSENAQPRARHFHAETRQNGGTQISARSAQVTVEVQRFIFDITLASSPTQRLSRSS